MSTRSIVLFAVACAATLTVAGCTKSSPTTPTTQPTTENSSPSAPSSSAPHSTSSSATHHAKPADYPTTSKALSTLVSKAVAKASTVQVSYHELAGQNVVNITGDEQLLRGEVADATFTETTSDSPQPTKIIVKNQVLYVQFPADAHKARPWLKTGHHSSDANLRALFGTLQAVSASGASDVPDFLGASTSFARAGTGILDGTPVANYTLTVSVAKLPKAYTLKSGLQSQGVSTFSLQVSVDAHGLPHELEESIAFNGKVVTSQVRLNHYGAHVRIDAPASRLVRSA